jgi:hypothetical protein
MLQYGIGYRNSIQKVFTDEKKSSWITAYTIDETMVLIGYTDAWL